MWKYVVGKSFDFYRYPASKKSGALLAPKVVRPLFGNLYLPHNVEILTRRIRSQRTDVRLGNLLTDVGWLSPEHEFWGRGEAFHQAIHEFNSALSGKTHSDLQLFAQAELGQEAAVASVLKISEIRHLHFFRRATVGAPAMQGRLELFLYPTGFVAALFYLSIPGNSSQWAPVGFVSALQKHTETAHRLFELAAGGPNYGGRYSDNRNQGAQVQDALFSESCGFLYFSDLRNKASTAIDEDASE